MAEPVVATNGAAVPLPSARAWLPAVLLAWLIPGAGHLYLKRYTRGGLLMICIFASFLLGLCMRGSMFEPQSGDLLTTIIYWGGYLANLASGGLYFVTSALGYSQPDAAGAVHDYGTKFLVAAGLYNILAIEDAFLIATGRKK